MNCPECGRDMTFVKAEPSVWGSYGADPPEPAYYICGCGYTYDYDAEAIEREELGEFLFLQAREDQLDIEAEQKSVREEMENG